MPSLTQVFEAVVRKGNVLVPIYHSSVKHLYVLMRVIRNGLYEKEMLLYRTTTVAQIHSLGPILINFE